jgi:hypothetical protein
VKIKNQIAESTRFVYLNKEVWPVDLEKTADQFLIEKLIRSIGAHELEVVLKNKAHPITKEFFKEKDLSLLGFGTGFFNWNKNFQGQLIDLKTSQHFIYILKVVAKIGADKDLNNVYGSYFLVNEDDPFLIGFNINKDLQPKNLILPIDQGVIIFPSCLITAEPALKITKKDFDNIKLDSHLILQPLRENNPEKAPSLDQFDAEEIFDNLVYGSFCQADFEQEVYKITALNKNLYLNKQQKDLLVHLLKKELKFSW